MKVEITDEGNKETTEANLNVENHLALAMKNKQANQIIEEKPEAQEDHSEYSEFIAPNAAPSEITGPQPGTNQ